MYPILRKKILNIGVVLFLFAVLIGGGLYSAHKMVRSKGYPGIREYLSEASANYARGLNASFKTIELQISEDDVQRMSDQREHAMQMGLMLNIGDNYVPSIVSCAQDTVEADIRLKGHMTDHLQENKWSFRIKTKDKSTLLGMHRFTLQHPGTRNYVYEWLFHQLAAEQGIISLNYDFVEVKVNDESWGIYALEEHLGQALLVANNRPPGAIVRFDPSLYWQGRLNERNRHQFEDDYATYEATYVDPYEGAKMLKDSAIKASYLLGQHKLEGFRRGLYRTSEVFDVELLARYMAIIDVVGGYHSLDWSDVKYYINPETQLLEPVAYESFGVRNLHTIAGQNRYRRHPKNDLFQRIFSDVEFYKSYVKALEEIADPAYFQSFLDKYASELNQKSAVLAREFAYKPFTNQTYFKNIHTIRRILEGPSPVRAFLDGWNSNQIKLVLTNTSGLPVSVYKLISGDSEIDLDSLITIEPKPLHNLNRNNLYIIDNPFDDPIDKLKLKCRIPGGEKYEVEVFEHRYFVDDTIVHTGTLSNAEGIHVDHENKLVSLSNATIDEHVFVPSGYDLWILNAQIELRNSRIYADSKVVIQGSEDQPVILDFSKDGGIVLSDNAECRMDNVLIRKPNAQSIQPLIACSTASLQLENVHLEGDCPGIQATNTKISINGSVIKTDLPNLQASYSSLVCRNLFCNGGGIDIRNSLLKGNNISISNAQNGIQASQFSAVNITKLIVESVDVGLMVADDSHVRIDLAQLSKVKSGYKIESSKEGFNPSSVQISSTE